MKVSSSRSVAPAVLVALLIVAATTTTPAWARLSVGPSPLSRSEIDANEEDRPHLRTLQARRRVENIRAELRRRGYDDDEVDSFELVDMVPGHRKSDVDHLYMNQMVDGIRVAKVVMNASLNKKNDRVERINMRKITRRVNRCVNTRVPTLTAEESLRRVADHLGIVGFGDLDVISDSQGPDQTTVFRGQSSLTELETITVELMFYRRGRCDFVLVWHTMIWPNSKEGLDMYTDASSGDHVDSGNFVSSASFSAIPPPKEALCKTCTVLGGDFNAYDLDSLVMVDEPPGRNWLTIDGTTQSILKGNNVHAYVDAETPEDVPDFEVPATNAEESIFDYRSQNLLSPDSTEWREAGATNMFVMTNILHDILYEYGFDEASGNFQERNFGLGGLENDSVNAEMQDLSGTNNANFATPVDGIRPRMQMFLFTGNTIIGDSSPSLSLSGQSYVVEVARFGATAQILSNKESILSTSTNFECDGRDGNEYADKVVFIPREGCDAGTKCFNAQNLGAVACVIINNVAGSTIRMTSGNNDGQFVTIPAIMISKDDGAVIRPQLDVPSLSQTTTSVTIPDPPSSSSSLTGPIFRDASFDNAVIAHEYCHGLSGRLTGGPARSDCLRDEEQAGEGWSDFCALFVTETFPLEHTRALAPYASGRSTGIRVRLYSPDMEVNELTYSFLTTLSAPHGIGTLFGSVLWDMYWAIMYEEERNGRVGYNSNKYQSDVGGSNIAFLIIVEGLKAQSCNPDFVQSRDGILAAAASVSGETHKCVIWSTFARRGLGDGAESRSTPSNLVEPLESFSVPTECQDYYDDHFEGVDFWLFATYTTSAPTESPTTMSPTGVPSKQPTDPPSNPGTTNPPSKQPTDAPSRSPEEPDEPDNSDSSSGGGGGGGGGGGTCFSGSVSVHVEGRGSIPLNEVRIGDRVHIGKNVYEPIYSFGHHDPNEIADFLRIQTPASTLEISPFHLVLSTSHGGFVPASNLRVGDTLLTSSWGTDCGDPTTGSNCTVKQQLQLHLQQKMGYDEDAVVSLEVPVESVTLVRSRGVFAPLTPSGILVVNDIVASTFVAFQDRPMRRICGVSFSYHWLAHTVEFPHRLVCHYLGRCADECYDGDGLSIVWVARILKLVRWGVDQNAFVKNVLLLMALPILLVFSMVEAILFHYGVGVMLTCWVAILVGLSSLRLRVLPRRKSTKP